MFWIRFSLWFKHTRTWTEDGLSYMWQRGLSGPQAEAWPELRFDSQVFLLQLLQTPTGFVKGSILLMSSTKQEITLKSESQENHLFQLLINTVEKINILKTVSINTEAAVFRAESLKINSRTEAFCSKVQLLCEFQIFHSVTKTKMQQAPCRPRLLYVQYI